MTTWVIVASIIIGLILVLGIGRWLYVILNRIEEAQHEDFEQRDN